MDKPKNIEVVAAIICDGNIYLPLNEAMENGKTGGSFLAGRWKLEKHQKRLCEERYAKSWR